MGVAIAIPFNQLCPGRPGIFDGNRSVTVGTVQLMSPISSDPPPQLFLLETGPRNESNSVESPFSSLFPASFCTAFANA